jgi:branched-subunit amino acid aminotransferase/4-amino-4-deoxychorismate lyase
MAGWIETMLVVEGKIPLIQLHAWRLQRGVYQSGNKISIEKATSLLNQHSINLSPEKSYRLRVEIQLSENNWTSSATISEWNLEIFSARHEGYKLTISKETPKNYLDVGNQKSTERTIYENAFIKAQKNSFDDVLVLNQNGTIADTSIFNVWILQDNILYTPSDLEAPVRGVFKEFLLRNSTFSIIEKEITLDEILNADAVLLSNALRGMQWVQLIDDKLFEKPEIVETINDWANDYLKLTI